MTKWLPFTLLFAPLGLFAQMAAKNADDLDTLYQSNRWFEFRDLMARTPSTTLFYRAQLDLAFHNWAQAEKELQAVIKPAGDPMQSFEAGLGLLRIYDLTGRRKDARALLAKMEQSMQAERRTRALDPAALRAFESFRAQLAAANDYPDQSIAARGRSRLTYAEVENALIVPLKINGEPANYVIDTGAEECLISAAEAKRLGLAVHPTDVEIEDGFDPDMKAAGVAVASDLTIGNFHLRNVLFLVEEGEDEIDGIIGLPVLLAFETVRWNSDGAIEFGFPPEPLDPAQSNLSFAGSLLLARAELSGKPLLLGLDTGAYESMLFPRFAREFAAAMSTPAPLGKRDVPENTRGVALSQLRLGGLDMVFAPAPVYPVEPIEDVSDLHGWLGVDLLGQAGSVTLDLGAMKLSLQGIADSAAGLGSNECLLPPDFRCLEGFSCVVKAAGESPCFIDRAPSSPPPGNALKSGPSEQGNCYLPDAAHCSHGMICRAVFVSKDACHIVEDRPVPPKLNPGAPVRPPASVPAPPGTVVDVRDVLQRSLKYETLDLEPPKDYIFTEEEETRLLKADGSVNKVNSETREVMNLYDAQFTRTIRKDGQPLSPEKARYEQARFDKAVEKRKRDQANETPQAKARREDAARKRDAEQLLCSEEFLKMLDPHLAGSENVNGRQAWVVELKPAPNAAPRCNSLKVLARFNFRVWIDQTEYRWARFEGDNVAPVTWGKILVRVPAEGLHLRVEQTRHADGAWLESEEWFKVNAKLLLAARFRLEQRTAFSSYRKFQADSRLLDDGK